MVAVHEHAVRHQLRRSRIECHYPSEKSLRFALSDLRFVNDDGDVLVEWLRTTASVMP
jgi:hypothetical protein